MKTYKTLIEQLNEGWEPKQIIQGLYVTKGKGKNKGYVVREYAERSRAQVAARGQPHIVIIQTTDRYPVGDVVEFLDGDVYAYLPGQIFDPYSINKSQGKKFPTREKAIDFIIATAKKTEKTKPAETPTNAAVGRRVTFKTNGTEEYGRITKIGTDTFDVKVWDSVAGEYYTMKVAKNRVSYDD
jgi:hypothetical protein